jgi:multisubunit Na+/H+ antiporter MnhB subunit
MIWITCVLTILLNIAIGIAFLVNKKFEFASITLICALLFTWIFYSFRNRIPFAKVVLKTAARVTGQFPATMFAGFIGLCVEIGLTILFFLSVGNITYFSKLQRDGCLKNEIQKTIPC